MLISKVFQPYLSKKLPLNTFTPNLKSSTIGVCKGEPVPGDAPFNMGLPVFTKLNSSHNVYCVSTTKHVYISENAKDLTFPKS